MYNHAMQAIKSGLCVLPPKEDGSKAPLISWKQFQKSPSNETHIKGWYKGKTPCKGIGYVTGATSGNLEVMDFDIREYYDKFCAALDDYDTDLASKLLSFVESSPKGMHVYYRCAVISGNLKLASVKGKVAIETRGEGGYIVAAPSGKEVNKNGVYVQVTGDFSTIPTLTESERAEIHRIATVVFDDKYQPVPKKYVTPVYSNQGSGLRPGDDFNRQCDVVQLLQKYGWTQIGCRGSVIEWIRPSSQSSTLHATSNHNGIPFYVFSSNAAPLEPNTGYDAFALYAHYEHNGDFSAAASCLSGQGFGEKSSGVGELPSWHKNASNESKQASYECYSLADIATMEIAPINWIVDGILPEGCHVLGGSPKIGKSFLSLDLALTITNPGRKLFGHFNVKHGGCLYLALEDSWGRIKSRTETIKSGLPNWNEQSAKSNHLAKVCIQWPPLGRGCIELLESHLADHPDTKLVIVDTLQKVRPLSASKGANAYEIDYTVVSQFQQFAIRHHIAVILITHLRKSSLARDEDPFEQITGSMGISGAADSTFRFKRGQNSEVAELYVRGRDIEEQCIHLRSINAVWHYLGDAESSPAHMDEIREYVTETKQTEIQPSKFNKWHRENYGSEISGIRVIFKRLYDNGHLRKVKDGIYAML